MAQPPVFFAAQAPPNATQNAISYDISPAPPMPNTNLGANHDVPVKIMSVNSGGKLTQLSKAYPRHILFALSGTMTAWLIRLDGRFVRTITIRDDRVSRVAAARILSWLFDLWASQGTSLQIPVANNETLDMLTQLYQGIVYLDVSGEIRNRQWVLLQIGNQSALRNKIWYCINNEQLTKENVLMVWTRLRTLLVFQSRCVHQFIDQVDAQGHHDVWAEYQTYFSEYGGLWSYIKTIREKKAFRMSREQQEQQAHDAHEDDRGAKELEDLVYETKQLALEA